MRTLLIGVCMLALTGAAYAHPGQGVGGGPPAAVTFGPPAAATAHIPNGVANGIGVNNGVDNGVNDGVDQAANLLGNLNAAHASPTALEHASPKSIVGALAIYKAAMTKALADLNAAEQQLATDQANNAPASQITADENAIAAANAEITAAENALALRANKSLTGPVIAKVNMLLGI